MNRLRTLLVAGALLGVALAPAATDLAAQDAEAPPVSRYRSAVMDGLQSHTGALRVLGSGEVPWSGQALAHAESVRALAAMLAEIFPEGSGGEGTRALPAIWEDPAGFAARVSDFQGAADALLAAARSGDAAALQEASQAVTQGCRACHGDFRARQGG